jgi:hypothetical protein
MLKNVAMIFFGATAALFGEIHTIDSLEQMAPHLKKAGKESLIVFDIDETLVISDKPEFQRVNFEAHKPIIKEVMQGMDPQKKPLLINAMLLLSEPVLIEEKTPALIKSWQAQGIKTMTLSNAMSGKLDGVDFIERRIKQFHRLGLDFSSAFKDHEELIFFDCNVYFGASARFKKGVLHSNGCHQTSGKNPEKGEILLQFLKTVNCAPKKLFFADDKLEIVQEVEQALKKVRPEIEFTGFHYQGARHFPSKILSPEEMKKAWQYLIEKTNSLNLEINP